MKRRTRRTIVLILGFPALALAVMFTVGALLPADHVVASRAVYPVPADSLWAVVSDFEHAASWRPDLQRVERLPDRNGHPVWLEVGPTGELPYEITASDPPRRMTTTIADDDLPFSGSWEYELVPGPGGTRLTVTERGTIRNAVFRFLARYLFGYHSTLDGYLTALGTRLGASVTPEHVPAG
jgi:uncharacterized protein YndB with AHSA1/START domain